MDAESGRRGLHHGGAAHDGAGGPVGEPQGVVQSGADLLGGAAEHGDPVRPVVASDGAGAAQFRQAGGGLPAEQRPRVRDAPQQGLRGVAGEDEQVLAGVPSARAASAAGSPPVSPARSPATYSSTTTWALVPPMPKELTPKRRGPSEVHGRGSVGISNGPEDRSRWLLGFSNPATGGSPRAAGTAGP